MRNINRGVNAQSAKQLEYKLTNVVAKDTSLNPPADLLALAQKVEDPHDTSKAWSCTCCMFVVIITNRKLEI